MKRTHFAPTLLIPVLTLLPAGCYQQAPPGTDVRSVEQELDPAQIVAQVEAEIPGLLSAARIAGISVCLLHDHEIEWCSAFGVGSEESGDPVDENTVFQAASLSKPVFAYTMLQLVDEGIISLDEPLLAKLGDRTAGEEFLGSEFADHRVETITARMILTHSCGFPNWRRNQGLQILFDPGERFSYSGEGFGLLQTVVEDLTGSTMEELVRAKTFEPLGMTASSFLMTNVDFSNYGWPHDRVGDFIPKPDDFEQRVEDARPHAAATLMTTAADYGRFLTALMTGTGLEEPTWRELLRPQMDVDDAGTVSWGLGTGLEVTGDAVHAWHWGDNGPTKAFFMVRPDSGDGLVCFANADNGLGVVADLVEMCLPGDHPVLRSELLTGYPQHDSADFRFANVIYESGAAEGIAFVRQLQQETEVPELNEGTVNSLGYWLLRNERLDEAIAVFEFNTELYPESWNVYDSLGEAQIGKGLREQGLANYRRSLELNPDNDNARRVLEEG